jgi:hypothetical protein
VPSSVHLDEPVYQERRSAKSFAIGKYRDVAAGKNLLNCLTGFCRAVLIYRARAGILAFAGRLESLGKRSEMPSSGCCCGSLQICKVEENRFSKRVLLSFRQREERE